MVERTHTGRTGYHRTTLTRAKRKNNNKAAVTSSCMTPKATMHERHARANRQIKRAQGQTTALHKRAYRRGREELPPHMYLHTFQRRAKYGNQGTAKSWKRSRPRQDNIQAEALKKDATQQWRCTTHSARRSGRRNRSRQNARGLYHEAAQDGSPQQLCQLQRHQTRLSDWHSFQQDHPQLATCSTGSSTTE